jgi:predicted amidohydrolase
MTEPVKYAAGFRADRAATKTRVASYQAPYLPFGSFDAVELIRSQVDVCEDVGVEVLCCPESIVGGLAYERDGQSPAETALSRAELDGVLFPTLTSPVGMIIGFTERDPSGAIYNSAAIIHAGKVEAVYRKVYPGYDTIIQAGTDLTVHTISRAPFGVNICNDLWYVEPARILAAAGAAVLFVPQNGGWPREMTESFQAKGDNLPIARAVENTMSVVVADIAGHCDGRLSYGFSCILDPDGRTLVKADPYQQQLLLADVDSDRRPYHPRGVDGSTNPAVTDAFVNLWATDR